MSGVSFLLRIGDISKREDVEAIFAAIRADRSDWKEDDPGD